MKKLNNVMLIITTLTLLLSVAFFVPASAAETIYNPSATQTGYQLVPFISYPHEHSIDQSASVYCNWSGLNPTKSDLKSHVIFTGGLSGKVNVENYDAGGSNDTVSHYRIKVTLMNGDVHYIAYPYVDAGNGMAGYAYICVQYSYCQPADIFCCVGAQHVWLGTTNGDVGTNEIHPTPYKHILTKYKFVANQYNVTYDANGADSGSVKSQGCTYDTAFKLRDNGFVKAGYSFTGWNTKKNGRGTSYSPNQSVKNLTATNNGTVTLYAQWKPNTYNIAYDGNGSTSGSVASQSATYNVDIKLSSNAFVKSGYSFNGWNTKADGTGTSYTEAQSVKNLTTENGGTVTLYAQWKAVNYTIHFDGNGSTDGSMEDMIATVGVESTLPVNSFTRTTDQGNSKFKGWNLKKDAVSADYTDQAKITSLTDQPNTTVTLYAIWDDCPQITAVDRYFTHDYATAGKITEEELLSTAKGTDKEDLTLENRTAAQVLEKGIAGSLTINDYQANKFTSLTSDAEVILTYLATDSSGNTFSESVTVHIYSTDARAVKKKTVRAIDWKYFNKSYEDGGLKPDSIWMTNPEYHETLKQALLNQENDTPVQVYNYSHKQILEMKEYINKYGYENFKKENGWRGFYDKFIKPQDEATTSSKKQ